MPFDTAVMKMRGIESYFGILAIIPAHPTPKLALTKVGPRRTRGA